MVVAIDGKVTINCKFYATGPSIPVYEWYATQTKIPKLIFIRYILANICYESIFLFILLKSLKYYPNPPKKKHFQVSLVQIYLKSSIYTFDIYKVSCVVIAQSRL